jgi:hypothetical protein
MWRNRDIPSLQEGLEQFIEDIGLNRDGLIGPVYSPEIPADFSEAGLATTPIDAETLAELIGAAPPPPEFPAVDDAVARLERLLTDAQVLLPPGLIARILGGWLVSDIVVLVGRYRHGRTVGARAGLESPNRD